MKRESMKRVYKRAEHCGEDEIGIATCYVQSNGDGSHQLAVCWEDGSGETAPLGEKAAELLAPYLGSGS